jgi:hypothetical protein
VREIGVILNDQHFHDLLVAFLANDHPIPGAVLLVRMPAGG